MPRLGDIIRLFVQLRLGLGEEGFDIDLARQQTRRRDQNAEIVDIAINTLGNARELHLDCQIATVPGDRPVHLADRGGSKRTRVKALKPRQPALTPGRVQHLFELPGRHRPGIGAQPREHFGKLCRQQIARIHGDKLAHLHGRTAHLGQLPGQLVRIARRQGDGAQVGPLARGQGRNTARQHVETDIRGHGSQPRKAVETPFGHGEAVIRISFVHDRSLVRQSRASLQRDAGKDMALLRLAALPCSS